MRGVLCSAYTPYTIRRLDASDDKASAKEGKACLLKYLGSKEGYLSLPYLPFLKHLACSVVLSRVQKKGLGGRGGTGGCGKFIKFWSTG